MTIGSPSPRGSREARLLSPRILAITTAAALIAFSLAQPSSLPTQGLTASLVGDLQMGTTGSEPQELTNVAGVLYFTADNGTNGRELWKSDPKTGETRILIDLNQGSASSNPSGLVNYLDRLYFAATGTGSVRKLWVYEPERGTTEVVVDTSTNRAALAPENLTPVGPFLFFTANGTGGRGLWFLLLRRSGDQITNIVRMLPNVPAGGTNPEGATPPGGLTAVDGALFFRAYNGMLMRYQLWKAAENPDAIAPTAFLVRDLDPLELVNFNGVLYFRAFDQTVAPGSRLWRSDGTDRGTEMLGPNVIVRANDVRPNLVPVDKQLFFPGAATAGDGTELFVTNGMVTDRVKDIYPGLRTSNPRELTKVFGVLFFSARDGIVADPPEEATGQELWRSNGAENGTRLVKDIYPTPPDAFDDTTANSSSPRGITDCAGIAFFGATDPDSGAGGGLDQNLWTSDGTRAGTERVGGLPNKCDPDKFTLVNTTVFFTAEDVMRGRELWKVNLPDEDGDGLLDKWETDGIDYDMDGSADLNLASMGARSNHKDVFVEVDFMTGNGHTHNPRAIPSGAIFADNTLQRVTMAFATTQRVTNPDDQPGISLHADEPGDQIPEIIDLPFQEGAVTFQNLKRAYFGLPGQRNPVALGARRLAFRYAVFGHTYAESPESSGIATLEGPDLFITLGRNTWEEDARLFNVQFGGTLANEWFDMAAGTFMHELGHTLGLRHGGGRGIAPRSDDNRNINFKPNYLSVMNYAFQRNRVGQALRLPLSANGQRVRTNRPLDYSSVALPELRENLLDESAGIGSSADRRTFYGVYSPPTASRDPLGRETVGPGNGAIDWNGDGFITGPTGEPGNINFITNYNSSPPGERLLGHDDWPNLVYNFRDSYAFLSGGAPERIIEPEETFTQFHESNFEELGGADLGIMKMGSPPAVTPGGSITYSLVITNGGPAGAANVVVTDDLEATTSFVSCNARGGGVCGGTGNNRTITFASLANGASAAVTLVATVNSGLSPTTIINNLASVTSTTVDRAPGNNSSGVTTQVISGSTDCMVCHKGRTTLILRCNNSEYRRHLDHGDARGACPNGL